MVMTPYPGTAIFNEYKAEERIRSFDWDLYNNYCPVITTRHMNSDTLVAMLAYCNVAFNGYRSLMKRNNMNALLLNFMLDLFQLTFLLRVNKNISEQAIIDLLFNALQLFLEEKKGIVLQTDMKYKKQLQHPLHLRLEHPSGKSIDFTLSEHNSRRELTMQHNASNMEPLPVGSRCIKLGTLVACACSISMDSLMTALYQNEWAHNNPKRITAPLLSLLTDRSLQHFGRNVALLYLRVLLSGKK